MAAQIPFALAPALVGAQNNELIDYSTRAGQSLYHQAIQPLPYTFKGRESSIVTLLQAVCDRSATSGWSNILSITVGQDANGNDINRDLLTHYGEITLAQVRTNAEQDYIGLQVRNAQISAQIYQCLRNSISPEVSERMVTESSKYFISEAPDGPSFLMTLIEIYLIQTKGTPTQLRLELAKAPQLIVDKNYDIDAFNTIIDAHVQKLSANGEKTEDLFAHLTRAYKKVPDKAFAAYMRKKIDDHNDGTTPLTANTLMAFAKKKYEEITADHEWILDDSNQKLVALTAQLEQVRLDNHQFRNQLRAQQQRA